MEEVHRIANATYKELPEKTKKQALDLFQSIDRNGDGKIVISEFYHYFENASQSKFYERSPDWLYMLFQDLDVDKNRSLDFNEFITLFYLLIFGVCCAQCRTILNGKKKSFTCLQCFKNDPFDLCCSCFSRCDFTHTHTDKGGVAPIFVNRAALLPSNNSRNQDVGGKAVSKLAIKSMVRLGLDVGWDGLGCVYDKAQDLIDEAKGKAEDVVDGLADGLVEAADNIVDVVADVDVMSIMINVLDVLSNFM